MRKLIFSFMLLTSCISLSTFGQNLKENNVPQTQEDEEAAVKAAVEDFLLALGNGEVEKVKHMFLPNANIGSITMAEDSVRIFSISAEQYLSQREGKPARKFQEPVSKYTINISQGILAFVRADATVYYDDKPSHHTNDFFILMKDNGTWKFLSGSYTVQPLSKD